MRVLLCLDGLCYCYFLSWRRCEALILLSSSLLLSLDVVVEARSSQAVDVTSNLSRGGALRISRMSYSKFSKRLSERSLSLFALK